MGSYVPLRAGGDGGGEVAERSDPASGAPRLASLDVFRGLSIALMIFVDWAGPVIPSIAHAPWNGLRLADFVLPFFLFIAGVSLALAYKRIPNKMQATYKVMLRTAKLFLLGILLQGGYLHGINSLTFGVDVEMIRWLGILQRIASAYIITALCEIWSSSFRSRNLSNGYFQKYYLHWFIIFSLSVLYMALLYGMYVPDWEFKVPRTSVIMGNDGYVVKMVKCSIRGDLGPGCNSAGMIDRKLLGIEHLYKKPTYRNLRECSMRDNHNFDDQPPWCEAPFDPEGILSSLMATVTCLIGLHYGHVLVQEENHKGRLHHWLLFSFALFILGFLFYIAGIPLNKSLYTLSYMLITTSSAGVTFSALYILVDVCYHRYLFIVLQWMGRHALSIFILIASNVVVIAVQGFYWRKPDNNIIHWIVSSVHE